MAGKSVRLPHRKNAADVRTKKMNTPKTVIISMTQGLGSPCVPIVKVGDSVKTGQLIADSDAFISAPIFSSITGKVVAEKDITNINGKINKALVIEAENRQELSEEISPPKIENRDDLIKAVRNSGLVGLGGAGFPTHVKIGFDPSKFKVDTLIINGAECEPYLTTDYCEFMENSEDIIKGIRLVAGICKIPKTIIAIEKNKPEAIKIMRELTSGDNSITVKTLGSLYPQGAEKVLIHKTTGRVVMEGQLPLSVGCMVMNTSGVSFIARYAQTGIPLINRRITIDGNIVNKPMNLLVPIGTPLSELMSQIDLRLQPEMIIFGGPMMGSCVYDLDTPISKTTGAVLLFNNIKKHESTPCIRCGKCVRACSMGLMPTELEKAYDARDLKKLEAFKIMNCMECGACSFACPAKRNISEKNRLAKGLLRK